MSALRLWWFDLTRGTPTAVSVLLRELGRGRGIGLLLRFVWRKITSRPFRALERSGPLSPGERFTRHQLLPVLLLDDLLQDDASMDQDAARQILSQVVGESGARFIRYATGDPSPEDWAQTRNEQRMALANRSLRSFGNLEFRVVEDPASSFAFDVTRCHFVSLCHELDRPHLAPLFCQADEVLFGDPRLGVTLRRDQTLASGHDACTFRLSWDVQPEPGKEDAEDPAP